MTTSLAWVLQITVAGMFLFAGGSKLAGVPEMVAAFDVIGLGQWFRYLTGGIEVVSAVLLLLPRFAVFGALALIPTMVGAIITHVFILGGSVLVPALLLAASIAIAWLRRHQFSDVFGRAATSTISPASLRTRHQS